MMAPPNTLAAAAVSPSSTLVRMGDMRKKNIRLQARNCLPVETRLAASRSRMGQASSLRQKCARRLQYRAAKILPRGERARRETPMRHWLQLIGWLACVVYSTIPAFWLMIHPFAEHWRARHLSHRRSPYALLVPMWLATWAPAMRSEEHTSELQSPDHLVCRLLLEKKKYTNAAMSCSRYRI